MNVYQTLKKGTILLLIVISSCSDPNYDSFEPIESVLNGEDYKIHNGILTFKNQATFDKFVADTKDRTNEDWNSWELANGFKSLATIHEEIIEDENKFLEEMNVKYNGSETITRKDIGYTPKAEKLIAEGFLLANEYETLDLNIPIHFYARLLNKTGILRIANEIHVPKTNFILVINDGDMSKVSIARTFKVSDQLPIGTSLIKVTRNFNSSIFTFGDDGTSSEKGARVAYVASCDNVNSPYRLIVYDGTTGTQQYNDGSFPCPNITATYTVRLRSLKKILGTWQNHKTSQWSLTSNFRAELLGSCDPPFGALTSYGIIANYSNYSFTPIYGHTWDQDMYRNVPASACSVGGLDSCPDGSDPVAYIRATPREHYATGKGGTICYVGD